MKIALASIFTLSILVGCGDDTTSGCPVGFVLVGADCVPAPADVGGGDGTTPDAGDAGDAGDAATPCDANLVLYQDMDGDGFGDPAVPMNFCEPTAGFVDNMGDCDDALDTANPDATEVCDAVDNDCDFNVDEGLLELGEATNVNFGIRGDQVARVEAYAPGFVIALSEGDERKVVAVSPTGSFMGSEWGLGTTGETKELHVLSGGLRALVLEEPSFGVVNVRVLSLDGTAVSEPFLLTDDAPGDIRLVEVGDRTFAAWIAAGTGASIVRRVVEIDVAGNTRIGAAVTVCESVEPGVIGSGLAPLHPKADGSGFFAVCLDRREGDLVPQVYVYDVSIGDGLTAGEPVRFGSETAPTLVVTLVSGFAGAPHSLFLSTSAETANILWFSLDDSLAEVGPVRSVEAPAAYLVTPASQPARWLLLTDGETSDVFLPDGDAEGQQLRLPLETQDVAQRTPNSGAVVYQNGDEYMFQPIGCTL